MKELAPIVLFVYARPEHTKNMIESLAKNKLAKESEVYIFCDNAKKEKAVENVNKVREYVDKLTEKKYFKTVTIIKAEKNKGLANSVIEGVTRIINKYGKVIVLEDDLVVSKYYIQYMNDALNIYETDKKIWSISGYNLPIEIPNDYKEDIYLGYRGCSWGWATWADRWNTVDWQVKDYNQFKHNYKKRKKLNRGGPDMAQMLDLQMKGFIDSWAIRWCYEQSKQDKFTIYPIKSLVVNQGLDGSGTHSGDNREFDVELSSQMPKLEKEIKVNKIISKNFYNKFNYGIRQTVSEIFTIIGLKEIVKLLRRKK